MSTKEEQRARQKKDVLQHQIGSALVTNLNQHVKKEQKEKRPRK